MGKFSLDCVPAWCSRKNTRVVSTGSLRCFGSSSSGSKGTKYSLVPEQGHYTEVKYNPKLILLYPILWCAHPSMKLLYKTTGSWAHLDLCKQLSVASLETVSSALQQGFTLLIWVNKKTHVKSLSQCLVYPVSSINPSGWFSFFLQFLLQWLIVIVPSGPCKLCSHLFSFFSPFARDFITTHKMCQADSHTTGWTLCGLTAEFTPGAENSVWQWS